MAKFLAHLFLVAASYATILGNYWFTYGIWPRSWISFAAFGGLTIILMILSLLLARE